MNRNIFKSLVALNVAAATASLGLIVNTVVGIVTDYDGPARFEQTTITVKDTTGLVNVEAATGPWTGAVTFVETTGPADITFITDTCSKTMCGGEARKTYRDGNYIAACVIAVESADHAILTHEVGHCLGLSHDPKGLGSNMHWFAGDYDNGWSDVVTQRDRTRLANLYR